jgi:hypothetical protein
MELIKKPLNKDEDYMLCFICVSMDGFARSRDGSHVGWQEQGNKSIWLPSRQEDIYCLIL